MKMKFLLALLLLVILLPDSVAQLQSQQDLTIPLQNQSLRKNLLLEPATKQWLDNKKTITVGVEKHDAEPFGIIDSQEYRGIVADYLSYISRVLHITVEIKIFNSKSEKLNALKTGQVDVITEINVPQDGSPVPPNFYVVPFIKNYPLTVRRLVNGKEKSSDILTSKLGCVVGATDPERIREKYPNTELYSFSNDKDALNGLITDKSDGIAGDLISNSYYVNQYHIRGFRIKNISPGENSAATFYFMAIIFWLMHLRAL